MAKTAVKFAKANVELVVPGAGKDGITQPPYARGKHVIHTSFDLLRRNACIASKLKGKKFPDGREAVIKAFKEASSDCK